MSFIKLPSFGIFFIVFKNRADNRRCRAIVKKLTRLIAKEVLFF